MQEVRRPAVAGLFYPSDPRELQAVVRAHLDAATVAAAAPKAIIVPHAGYVYSGPVAGFAFARARGAAAHVERVVIVGPAHRVPCRTIALPSAVAFAFPGGHAPLDRDEIARLAAELPWLRIDDAPHAPEHSIEVQLPFLAATVGSVPVVPACVGAATDAQVGEFLHAAWGGPETLIVVSTDLSHYLSQELARQIDDETRTAVEKLRPEYIGRDQACGGPALRGLLGVARERGMRVETLDLRTSGDTAGQRDRVVGYGAWALFESSEGKPC